MNGVTRIKPPPAMVELRAALIYDEATGYFLRRKSGRRAGSPEGRGYWRINLNGVEYKAHRLAWFWMTGEWPEVDIDHINGDRIDNRFANLRLASRAENLRAASAHRDKLFAAPKGVSFDRARNKWAARIYVNGKHCHLGRYPTKEQAASAYTNAARKHFGDFAARPGA